MHACMTLKIFNPIIRGNLGYFLLPNLDSNQDKQSQSLSYYRYTIRQCFSVLRDAKI